VPFPVTYSATWSNILQTESVEIKSASSIEHVIRSRRTIHSFRLDPIPESAILDAIDVARWAPNHKMTEPWTFYLLGPKTVSLLADMNVALHMDGKSDMYKKVKRAKWLSMPTTTVITSKKCQDALRTKENYAATCCAIHNFSLYLWDKGIGSKWSTTKLTRTKEMYDILGLDPREEEIVGILWAGYPEEVPSRDRTPVEASVVRMD